MYTDYFKTALSLGCAALSQLPLVLASIIPHLFILATFGAFVLWNGSVVLGHKEFHTASIHIPQMLYIWPYFAFFSFPMMAIGILNVILPSRLIPKYINYCLNSTGRLPSWLTAAMVIPMMLGSVHFNTIVHPFTLADNRHYIFYIFRLLTRYHPAVKYAVVPVYFICAWAVIGSFGLFTPSSPKTAPLQIATPQDAFPSNKSSQESPNKIQDGGQKKKEKKSAKSTSSTAGKSQKKQEPQTQVLTPEIFAKIQAHVTLRKQQLESQHVRVSFVLIWLVATTLSLITAPLVEPRYFIIPWVIWRLHLPRQPAPEVFRNKKSQLSSLKAQFFTTLPEIMETIWFLIINAVTGYVFLYKGFEWPQEPGKVQRFLW